MSELPNKYWKAEELLAEIERLRADNERLRAEVAAERKRCAEEVLKCADRALVSWNSAQEIAAAIRKDAKSVESESSKGEKG